MRNKFRYYWYGTVLAIVEWVHELAWCIRLRFTPTPYGYGEVGWPWMVQRCVELVYLTQRWRGELWYRQQRQLWRDEDIPF